MPPKEKKGKKKESPEQKKARLEMEALAAKEAEAARAEMAKTRLKEQRLREEAAGRASTAKLNAEWLQRMRKLKLEELRSEASALAREHDREVDRRDRLIEGLVEELRMAGDQHNAAVGSHMRIMDELLELQEKRMDAAQARFGGDLKSIQEEFEREKAEMVCMHARQRKEAQAVLAALESSYADAVQEASSTYTLAQDEVKGKCSEEYNVLKLALEQKVAGLEGQIEAQHKAYVASTRQHDDMFRDLSRSDREIGADITTQTQRLRQLQETLVQWRGRIVHNSKEWERNNSALAKEKEAMVGHQAVLKGALARFRQGQEQRLKQMCASSAAVQASLRERLELAGRILKAAELCRRLQLPGDNDMAGDSKGSGEPPASPARQEGGSSTGGCGEGGNWGSKGSMEGLGRPELAAFFQRLNKIYLDVAALDQQRLRLSTENAALRAVVKKVEEGTTVSPDVLDDPLNTLVVINSRLQNALRGSRRGSAGASQQKG